MIFTGKENLKRERSRTETWVAIVNLVLSFLAVLFIPYFETLLKNLL